MFLITRIFYFSSYLCIIKSQLLKKLRLLTLGLIHFDIMSYLYHLTILPGSSQWGGHPGAAPELNSSNGSWNPGAPVVPPAGELARN